MTLYNIDRASRIAEGVEANVADLITKMCEGEKPEVERVVWSMVATRIAFRSGRGDCFRLPALEDC